MKRYHVFLVPQTQNCSVTVMAGELKTKSQKSPIILGADLVMMDEVQAELHSSLAGECEKMPTPKWFLIGDCSH